MGVDYYNCDNCNQIYNDYGYYYNCGKCWSGFCESCGEKELIEKYGIWDADNPEHFDKDGCMFGEEGCLKSCPVCKKEKIDYEILVKRMSSVGMTVDEWGSLFEKSIEELWAKYKDKDEEEL